MLNIFLVFIAHKVNIYYDLDDKNPLIALHLSIFPLNKSLPFGFVWFWEIFNNSKL